MDLGAGPRTATVVRRASEVLTASLVLVGAWELRGAPLVALLALGGLALSARVIDTRLAGDLDGGAMHRLGTRAARVTYVIVAAIGDIVLLDNLDLIYGAAAIAIWWKIGRLPSFRRRARPSERATADAGGPGAGLSGPAGRSEAKESRRSPAPHLPSPDPLGARAVRDATVGSSAGQAPPARGEDLQKLVRELDDPALAQAWADVQPAEGKQEPAENVRMSLERRAVLDELERRNPAEFSAWLERGAPVDDPPVARRPDPGRP